MSENSLDGLRRYEDIVKEISEKADNALAIAIQNAVVSNDGVLDIAHGGTGSSTKNFVDLETNQYNILGSKLFKASAGFQLQSYEVDSQELAGNIRLISCDEQDIDVGPQMRFSGRNTDGNLTPYAFATIAGRKENGHSGDYSGYLQFATTLSDKSINESGRFTSFGDFGIGAIPNPGDRLHVSGGDILLDNVGGTRMFKLSLGELTGRVQAITNLDGTDDDSESMILSVNAEMGSGSCLLDSITGTYGSAAIDIRANGTGVTDTSGMIRFLAGDIDDCPTVRGIFSTSGLDVIGDAYITGNVVAGGSNNIVDGPGNNVSPSTSFVTSDNIKFGNGSPEGYVHAPIGAIYGRGSGGGATDPDENSTLWVKVFNDGGNTGWLPLSAGDDSAICIQANCPDFSTASNGTETPDCNIWFDTGRNIQFYWDPDVVRTLDPENKGAWLSTQLYQYTIPITGRSHTQQFKGQIDKDYEYISPMMISRHKLNMYLVDMTAALRQDFNGNDSLKNYYTFDLLTLKRRQGKPVANANTRQEWPGDREAYDTRRDNLRGDGHTIHHNLSEDLLELSSHTPSGPPADGTGYITTAGSTRRTLKDTNQSWTAGQWKERENDDSRNGFAANNGFRVRMTSGTHAGIERTIRNNTSDTITLRRPWPRIGGVDRPAVNDTYEILDSQHQRIIARISTKGNVWPYGAHVDPDEDVTADPPPLFDDYKYDDAGVLVTRAQAKSGGLFKTRDVQDFVTSVTNGLDANTYGGNTYEEQPSEQYIQLDHYIDIYGADDATNVEEPTDAVLLAGLWDAVRRPGKLSGCISVSYRLAIAPSVCEEGV